MGRWVFFHRFVSVLCVCLCCGLTTRGAAGARPSAHPETLAVAQASPEQAGSPQSTPSESKTQEQTRTEQYTLSHERQEKAIAYSRAGYTLYFLSYFLGGLFLFLILRLGWAARFRDMAENVSDQKWIQGLVFVPLLFLTVDVLDLPVHLYWHALSLHYQQSIQGWGSWFWDWSKGELLGLVVSIPLVWLFYAVVRRSPRRWWFYAWLGTLPLVVFVVFLSPLVIEPPFFRFTPLAASNPQLAAQLERVVIRAGQDLPENRLFLMNASTKLNELNAYVTGIGASRRVVVWDTTIARMTTPEILFIFGHEMGHYVLGHIRDGIIFAAVVLFVAFFAGFHVLRWALRSFGMRWDVHGVDDWASLPVLLLLFLLASFVLTPIDNAYSRHLEHQADQYGLEVVHGIVPDAPDVAAQSFQILGDVDLEEPNPPWLVKVWFYTHPSIAERIVFARTYDPWSRGKSPEFVK